MNKTMKIVYKCGIGINILAGLVSIISLNYVLGMNQILVAWFMYLYYNEAKERVNKINNKTQIDQNAMQINSLYEYFGG